MTNYYSMLPVPVRLKGELQIVNTPEMLVERILDGMPEAIWKRPDYKWLVPFSKNGAFERGIGLRLMRGLKISSRIQNIGLSTLPKRWFIPCA